jgi:hypothetical protein
MTQSRPTPARGGYDLAPHMTLREMNAAVGAELAHIPRGRMPQGLLRATYQQARLASLGRKRKIAGSARDILKWSIRQLQDDLYPGHPFEYDEAYFRSTA